MSPPSFPSRLPLSLSKRGHLRPALPCCRSTYPPFISYLSLACAVPGTGRPSWPLHRHTSFLFPSFFFAFVFLLSPLIRIFLWVCPSTFLQKSCQTVTPLLPTAVCSPHSRHLRAHVAHLLLIHRTDKHVWKDNWNVPTFSVLSLDARDEGSHF